MMMKEIGDAEEREQRESNREEIIATLQLLKKIEGYRTRQRRVRAISQTLWRCLLASGCDDANQRAEAAEVFWICGRIEYPVADTW